jgi:hypothetical protein
MSCSSLLPATQQHLVSTTLVYVAMTDWIPVAGLGRLKGVLKLRNADSTFRAYEDFDENGEMIGLQYTEFEGTRWCCEGQAAYAYQYGQIGTTCLPFSEDTQISELLLLSIFLAQADTGEEDYCNTHPNKVDATWEEGICVSDTLADWCALYYEGPCPRWPEFLQQLPDLGWTLSSCAEDSEIGYHAEHIHYEYKAIFDFDKEGTMIGLFYTGYEGTRWSGDTHEW